VTGLRMRHFTDDAISDMRMAFAVRVSVNGNLVCSFLRWPVESQT
jgi:hypothetical protein